MTVPLIGLIIVIGGNLLAIGCIYGVLKTKDTEQERRIITLEQQKANELRIVLDGTVRRVDKLEELMSKVDGTLSKLGRWLDNHGG